MSPEVVADIAETPEVVVLTAVFPEAMAPAAAFPEVAACVSEFPEAAKLILAPCTAVVPSYAPSACHVVVEGIFAELCNRVNEMRDVRIHLQRFIQRRGHKIGMGRQQHV